MSDHGFKEYMENRTVADIMEDYGEQHGEWETLHYASDNEGSGTKDREDYAYLIFADQV